MKHLTGFKLFENTYQTEYLFGYNSELNAYLVDDYPYGFRQRTKIRYWIETANKGDRFCSQTLNPKTKRWNKPKKSTYTNIGIMYLNEENHVKWKELDSFSNKEEIDLFINEIGGENVLNEQQIIQLKQLRGEKVEVKTKSGKIKKDYIIRFIKSPYTKELIECNVKFNRPDKVALREIIDALSKTNQKKLYTVWDNDGVVRITLNRGYQLGNITKEFYEKNKN